MKPASLYKRVNVAQVWGTWRTSEIEVKRVFGAVIEPGSIMKCTSTLLFGVFFSPTQLIHSTTSVLHFMCIMPITTTKPDVNVPCRCFM